MSILIKGAKMPKNCYECMRTLGLDYLDCPANNARYDPAIGVNRRYDCCPLVEIPPHGRLIDADVFEEMLNSKGGVKLKDMPTVIESEEQEHE